ncbi:MAG: DUF2975 domain-containing protein [Erysipelotrichaceae bacterium]|nr:DUF2975 domain-containing protein [Erysipelotrichaceae bacterium]MDY5251953.1 DUF2975 domain-containing protein [Erysipelotrichaceae bacterium]
MGHMYQNYFDLMAFLPVIAIVLFIIMLYIVLKFDRGEAKMNFVTKIIFLDRSLKLILIFYLIGFVVGMAVILATSGLLYNSFGVIDNFPAVLGVGSILTSVPLFIQLYFYYLIYKEYKILINNLKQEIIFDQNNVKALKKIAKVMIWILILNLILYILSNCSILLVMLAMISNYGNLFMDMNIDINTILDINVLLYFVVCIIFNILAEVMAKATEIYEENQLTI